MKMATGLISGFIPENLHLPQILFQLKYDMGLGQQVSQKAVLHLLAQSHLRMIRVKLDMTQMLQQLAKVQKIFGGHL